jgi:hypothetical protein
MTSHSNPLCPGCQHPLTVSPFGELKCISCGYVVDNARMLDLIRRGRVCLTQDQPTDRPAAVDAWMRRWVRCDPVDAAGRIEPVLARYILRLEQER